MSYPGADYGRMYPDLAGSNAQYTQGIDPDWTKLATMYGFRPNPYPALGTEGQDQMRFLATLKSIADAQLGGPSGPYSQMSPNNPIAAMPFGMAQYMTSMAPLFQSIQGRNLMPLDQANMLANGYQYGPLGTGTESALMKTLREARTGGPAGQGVYTGPAVPGQSSNTTPGAAAEVSGGNTPDQNPPSSGSGGLPAGFEATPAASAQDEIRTGLVQAAANSPSGSGVPRPVPADQAERVAASAARATAGAPAGPPSPGSKQEALDNYINAGIGAGILPPWVKQIISNMANAGANAINTGAANRG
jgi:hypothetical protein